MTRRLLLLVSLCALALAPIGASLGVAAASASTTSCPKATNEANAQLGGANLAGCNFTNFNLTGANFSGANLTGAIFTGATLSSANFSGSNLSKATLSPLTATSTNFQGANLAGDNLSDDSANNATFQGDNLASTNFASSSLTDANFQGANLSAATLTNISAVGASFQGDNLSSAQLDGATVSGDNFQGANLSSANLVKTSAAGALFQGDNLAKVDFNSGNLSTANVQGANSAGATCVGTNLYGLIGTLSCTGGISVQVPGTPTNVKATAGNGSATVSFTAPSTGGTPTSYTVASSPGNFTVTGTASPISVSGLTNGVSYTFTVTANNAGGSGPASSPSASVTPVAVTVPSAPAVSSVSVGNGTAQVTFSPPSNTGGASITSYAVVATPVGGGTAITATGSASPIDVSGLTNGTAYTFTVAATNSAGTGSASTPSSSETPTGPPSAPTITAVTTSSASATVAFTPGSNGGLTVGTFTVTATPTGGGTAITATGSASAITVTGLTNGTAYTFTVTATNSAGTSPASAPSNPSAPTGVPGAPSVTSVTIGNGQASVAFSPPSATGGQPISSYSVSATPTGGGTAITATGSTSPTTVSGLTNGTAYTFTVAATNANGTGNASAPSAPATPQGAPPTPVISNVSLSGTSASITFTEDTSSTGSTPVTYAVTSSPAGLTTTCSASPCVVSDLVEGTNYTFAITASDAYGTSAASIPSQQVTATSVPQATSITAVTATSNGQATVSFDTFIDNTPEAGGLPISGYTVTASPGGQTATCGSSPCIVSGLTNGAGYSFTVIANNADGEGPASPASSTTTVPAAAPSAPSIASITPANGSASVTVVPPTTDNGAAVTSYTVTAEPGNLTGTATANSSGDTTVTVSGLSNGTAYTFSAVADNAAGSSTSSAPSAPVTPSTVPDAPTITSLTPGEGSITVAYAAPDTDGGSAISGYVVTATPLGGGSTVTAGGSASPIVVSGLTNGEAYTFTVLATNSNGNSAASDTAPATGSVSPGVVPGAPTSVSAMPEDGAATVSFTPPSDNGGLPVTSYVVTAEPGNVQASCSASPCVVAGLSDGQSYTFSVTAVNSVGTGTASSPSTGVIPLGVPSAPSITSVTAAGQSASVSFSAPTSDGGLAITSYTVTSSPGAITASCTSSPCAVAGLTDGTAYTFTVTATNAEGSSVASAPSATPVTPLDAPSAPGIGSLSSSDGQAIVEVIAPSDDGGSPITSYTVTSSPGGITATCAPAGTTTPCSVTGLTDGVTYTFTATATNTAGTSASSAVSASAATPSAVPDAPTVTGVIVSSGSATVIFVPSSFNGGFPTTSYTVTSNPGGVTASGASSPITVTGLTNGVFYSFSATATNAVGTSAASIATSFVMPTGPPSAPSITGVVPGNGDVQVAFSTLTNNGGSPITSYTVTTVNGDLSASGTSSPITLTGLSDGTSYQVVVTATNALGTSSASAPSQGFSPTGPPGPPVIYGITAANGQVYLGYTPGFTGGFPAGDVDYTVVSSPSGGPANCEGGTCSVAGLTNGQSYTFVVIATNADGSTSSAPSASVTPVGPASAPIITSVVPSGDATLTVTLSPPSNDGGTPITSYIVVANPVGASAASATTTVTLTGLSDGISYSLVAYATTAAGAGALSAAVSGTPGTVPEAPVIDSISGSGTSATVNVDSGTGNGGYPITSWTLSASPALPSGDVVSTSIPIQVSDLVSGTSYSFTVTATNALGTSAPSTPYSFAAASSQLLIVQVTPNENIVDAQTGDLVTLTYSEYDPVTELTTTPPPAVAPTVAYFNYPEVLLTLDPTDGLYTTFEDSTVDISSGLETYDDGSGVTNQLDLSQVYFLTTDGTVVNVQNPSVQLDPVTLNPLNTNSYTVAPTSAEYSTSNGPDEAQA